MFVGGYFFLLNNKMSKMFFFVTNRCNFSCSWCLDNNRTPNNLGATVETELSVEEITLIAKRSRNIIPYIVLTGGEPFLRQDLYEMVLAFYRYSGTKLVTICTNGSLPDKLHEQLEKILILCPGLNINIQLTVSDSRENHDDIRTFQGSYDLLLMSKNKIKELQVVFPDLIFTIATQVDTELVEGIPNIIRATKAEFSPDEHFILHIRDMPKLVTPASEKTRLLETYTEELNKLYHANRNLIQAVYKIIILQSIIEINNIRLGSGKLYKCPAGMKFFTLYENGNIFPCENRPDLLSGNIRKHNYDLSDSRFLHNLEKMRQQQITEKCQCDWGCAVSQNLVADPVFIIKILKRLLTHFSI
jgi:radical SAM protein with 4Fe4S-binding SPASM domain